MGSSWSQRPPSLGLQQLLIDILNVILQKLASDNVFAHATIKLPMLYRCGGDLMSPHLEPATVVWGPAAFAQGLLEILPRLFCQGHLVNKFVSLCLWRDAPDLLCCFVHRFTD